VQYQSKADKIKEKINKDFWVEEFNSYAGFIGTKNKPCNFSTMPSSGPIH